MEQYLNLLPVDDHNLHGNVCIICCKTVDKGLCNLTQRTEVGYKKLKACAEERNILNDEVFSIGIYRILALPDVDDNFFIKGVLFDFTNKGKIERLRKRREKEEANNATGNLGNQPGNKPRTTGSRSNTDW